ncbi:chaoptin [Bombyx mori]|uniref:Chaoptin n=1 Tax=Bombyx mori TaxID=7091 RepID=A0A8R2M2D9_BOMMO|nr:chaoptin [Bombyx mori]
MQQWSACWIHAALAVMLLPGVRAPARPCPRNSLCYCRADHFACNYVPFHRFPETDPEVWHVSVSQARLGTLGEGALDGRRLRTLVLVASHLYHIEPGAFSSMTSTLASLDLANNEFTEIPIEALRELKVLNWLNLQNNYISELNSDFDWGFLSDSLSSLSLSNNHLYILNEGSLSSLHQLAQLDLDGNRLHAVNPNSLPQSLALLRLSDNILTYFPCLTLAGLPRLLHLHLRNNILRPSLNHTCRGERTKIESLDLSHNELDDRFVLSFQHRLQLKQLILDFNDFTAIPPFVMDSGRLEKLSISYNKLSYVSDAMIHALKRDLERLELDYNEIAILSGSVKEMVRLKHLSLAYNHLEEINDLPPNLYSLSLSGNFLLTFPVGLSTLSPASLAYLDLGYNQISVLSPESFGVWSEALVTLNLKGNRITQLVAGSFPLTLPLRELVLSFNDLYYVDPNAFANLTMLQVLELSSTLFSGEFPVSSYFDNLTWLSLDNNNVHYVSSGDLQNFPSLQYLNLEFNKITEFPSEVTLTSDRSNRLKELRLSYNYISKINSEFLSDLVELQSLDLSYNRVYNISENGFSNLHNLVYLSLSGNVVEFIAERAFRRLPKLEALDMHENNLLVFSTDCFENVSNDETNFSVNVSRNRISVLTGGLAVSINTLDLSFNFLESVSRHFFDSIGPALRQLIVSHNRLMHLDNIAFGFLPSLEVLMLHDNSISAIKKKAFAEMSSLQILDLSRNKISQLAVEQFHNMRRLRHLRLARNVLRSLPRDVFKNTILEHLDLNDNHIAIFPSSALAQVGFTLRRLELAQNHLEYLDAAMFHAIAFLHELTLARNALTVLSDNTFAGLTRLRQLDLSHNPVKTNFKELFHNLPRLRKLILADAGLKSIPHLPLANLTELDLSGNFMSSFREPEVRRLMNLRALNLARNKFTSLQPAMWAALPKLCNLDVSQNPIVRVTRGSFEGLDRLLHLRMPQLRQLEVVEPRAFRPLVSLRILDLESPIGSGRAEASLADISLSVPTLESLSVLVRESVLDTQLHGLRAPKLRSLEVHGVALRRVSVHAFVSLGQQRALTLRLRRTSITALPPGIVKPVARVPHLALDFSANQLVTFGPATLYPNLTGWNRLATKLLPGGLILSENPLRCGCSVSWVGAWLRRWTAEVGGWSRDGRDAARRSACMISGTLVPLLSLEADEAECHASALSSRALTHRPHTMRSFQWIVLLYALS